MNLGTSRALRVESVSINLSRRFDTRDATSAARRRQERSGSRGERPQGDDARDGPDRALLHADAARPAEPRPCGGRLLPVAGARRGVRGRERRAHRLDRPRGGDRAPGHRHGRDRPAQSPAPRGARALRRARQGGALHEAARAERGGGEADARHRRGGGHLRRVPRGPRLLAEDAQGGAGGPSRPDRPGDVGPLARDPPRPALRVVLGRRAGGRRRDRRPRLPLHRDRPQLHGQGEPAARGDGMDRHAGAPDRGGGQRDLPDPLRVGRDGAVRGLVDVPRWHGPARRGGRDGGDDLDEPLPADRVRDVLVGRGRRVRRGEGRVGQRVALPGRRRGRGARLRRHVHGHVRRARRAAGRRRRRSTTATSSTR